MRFFFLNHNTFAAGLDAYYYVLQVFSLRHWGQTFFNDPSITFAFLNSFGIFSQDIILTNKLAAAFMSACSAAAGAFIVFRLTGKWLASLVTSCFFSFTCSSFFLGMEFQKNHLGIVFFLWFLAFLLLAEKKYVYYLVAAVFPVLSLLAHKMTGLLSLLFMFFYLVFLIFFNRKTQNIRKILKLLLKFSWILILVVVLLVILNLFFAATLRVVDLSHLLDELDITAVGARVKAILWGHITIVEKIEYCLYHLLPFLFLPCLIGIFKNNIYSKPVKAFWGALWVTSLILINPFLEFTWDSIASRLLIVSFIPLGLYAAHLLWLLAAKNRLAYQLISLFLVIILFFNLPVAIKIYHSGRYPDYQALYSDFIRLKTLVPPGKKIIAHRGISTFIWYTTGIITENFQPRENYRRYYRLVYGLGPIHFEKLAKAGNFKQPVRIGSTPYLLMEEELWQAFYKDKQATLRFLDNPLNPFQLRPPAAYFFNEPAWKEKLKAYSSSIE